MIFDIETILLQLIINILVNLISVTPFLWIAGRLLAGKRKAKFADALWIVLIGTVAFYFFTWVISDFIMSGIAVIIAYIGMLIIWLALVKHFFDCDWLKALAISIIAVIIAFIILFIIALILVVIGIGIGMLPTANPLNSF
jgi:predicted lysophospholipase L1 biosynthesis ABC-type transport system permease subunit